MSRIIDKAEHLAIVAHPDADQIAIAKENISPGSAIEYRVKVIEIKHLIKKGQRFALNDIEGGEYIRQYGHAFGRSKGILKGELITVSNIENILPKIKIEDYKNPNETKFKERFLNKSFLGYKRKNGSIGTRNYYLVVPTSMCISETADKVARGLDSNEEILRKYPSIDGIVSIAHTEGCGCDSEGGEAH